MDENEKEIMKCLEKQGKLSQYQIQKRTLLSNNTAVITLYKLKDKRLVDFEREKKGRKPIMWWIV